MIKPWEQQEYNKGRQARLEGQPVTACHHREVLVTAWRRAGWHDLDLEKGKRIYFKSQKEAEAAA